MKVIVCTLAALAALAAGAEVNAQPAQQTAERVRLESGDVFSEAMERKITSADQISPRMADQLERYGQVEEFQIGTSGNLERKAAERLLAIQAAPDPQAMLRSGTNTAVGAQVGYPEVRKTLRPERVLAEYVRLLVERPAEMGGKSDPGAGTDPLRREAHKLFDGVRLREINEQLNARLHAAPDPEAKFVELLEEVRESLSADKQAALRAKLRAGTADAAALPWPLCVPKCP